MRARWVTIASTESSAGVAMLGEAAHLLHHGHERVDLHRAAALEILQHRGLVRADLAGALDAALDVDAEFDAEAFRRSPCVSTMIARDSARVEGSVQITSSVAWVSALIGLKQTLPQSFSQISSRMRSSTGAFRPAATKSSARRCTSEVISPEGSPSGKLLP